MTLARAEIQQLIPHAGRMCLLDEVLAWDDCQISATSNSHRARENPLRRGAQLSALCGIEYAAQAMAVHGALMAHGGTKSLFGFIAVLRDIHWRCESLDEILGPLRIEAEKLSGDRAAAHYRFDVAGEPGTLLTGRALVVLRESL